MVPGPSIFGAKWMGKSALNKQPLMSDPLGFKHHLLEGAGMSIYIFFIYLLTFIILLGAWIFGTCPRKFLLGACPLISSGLPLVSAVARFVAGRWSSQQCQSLNVWEKKGMSTCKLLAANCMETQLPQKSNSQIKQSRRIEPVR